MADTGTQAGKCSAEELARSKEEEAVLAKSSAAALRAQLLTQQERCEQLEQDLAVKEAGCQAAVKAANAAAKAAKVISTACVLWMCRRATVHKYLAAVTCQALHQAANAKKAGR